MTPRKGLMGLTGLALSAALVTLSPASPGGAVTSPSPQPTVISPDSPIKHVIVIYQENHTFDDVLGAYCQTRVNPCNGYSGPVTFADGTTAANIVQPDIVPAVAHDPESQREGLQNRWNAIGGCGGAPYSCVSHSNPANIPNLTAYADRYTVSDATFAAGRASSFVAHVSLGGGTFDGFAGDNPVQSKTGVKPRRGWGCESRQDAKWGPLGDRTYQPSCIPSKRGEGPYRASRVPYVPTIMQRMEQAGLTWHIYEGDTNDKPLVGPWSICTYFSWCLQHRFRTAYNSSRQQYYDSAAAGTLPNLSLIMPLGNIPIGGRSQHNGNSMLLGDNYIGQLVQAAMDGPDWESTAIFITYDDCGCFYDHVTPPHGLGLRNPMVIVSPWAKPMGTDSEVAVQPYSMLAFTEHAFGLEPLTAQVSKAYDYAGSFDFTQQPLRGPEATTQPIPRWEIPELRRLAPLVANDPT